MAFLSFMLDQLFMLLVPDLVVESAGTFNFPDEVDVVQKFLSIKSNFVVDLRAPLCADPLR
jgi:hypothetical protein